MEEDIESSRIFVKKIILIPIFISTTALSFVHGFYKYKKEYSDTELPGVAFAEMLSALYDGFIFWTIFCLVTIFLPIYFLDNILGNTKQEKTFRMIVLLVYFFGLGYFASFLFKIFELYVISGKL